MIGQSEVDVTEAQFRFFITMFFYTSVSSRFQDPRLSLILQVY